LPHSPASRVRGRREPAAASTHFVDIDHHPLRPPRGGTNEEPLAEPAMGAERGFETDVAAEVIEARIDRLATRKTFDDLAGAQGLVASRGFTR